MKKIPTMPPLSDALSALFNQELGILISNAPKNEIAKIARIKKKTILKVGLVDISFNTSAPKTLVTTVPNNIYIAIIERL